MICDTETVDEAQDSEKLKCIADVLVGLEILVKDLRQREILKIQAASKRLQRILEIGQQLEYMKENPIVDSSKLLQLLTNNLWYSLSKLMELRLYIEIAKEDVPEKLNSLELVREKLAASYDSAALVFAPVTTPAPAEQPTSLTNVRLPATETKNWIMHLSL